MAVCQGLYVLYERRQCYKRTKGSTYLSTLFPGMDKEQPRSLTHLLDVKGRIFGFDNDIAQLCQTKGKKDAETCQATPARASLVQKTYALKSDARHVHD